MLHPTILLSCLLVIGGSLIAMGLLLGGLSEITTESEKRLIKKVTRTGIVMVVIYCVIMFFKIKPLMI